MLAIYKKLRYTIKVLKRAQQNIAGWSSSVARRAHNPKVGGSNPPPATINMYAKMDGYSPIRISVYFL